MHICIQTDSMHKDISKIYCTHPLQYTLTGSTRNIVSTTVTIMSFRSQDPRRCWLSFSGTNPCGPKMPCRQIIAI